MTSTIVIASADLRHASSAKSVAESIGANTMAVVGAAFPSKHRDRLTRVGLAGHAVADRTYLRGPGLAKVIRRAPGVRTTHLKDDLWLAAELAFDRHVVGLLHGMRSTADPVVVHGFGGFAPATQIAAIDLGFKVVNDAFELHPIIERRVETKEYAFMGLDAPLLSYTRAALMERRLAALHSADRIIAGLPTVKESLVQGGIPGDKVRVGGYAVPEWLTSFQPPDRSAISGSDSAKLRLLFVGQVHWYKGLQRLLTAIELLDDRRVELTVCGARYPGAMGDRIFDQLTKLSGAGTVRYLGMVGRKELRAAFDRSHLMVFPSLVGGVGLAVLEAAACGLPLALSHGEGLFVDGESMLEIGTEPRRIAEQLTWVLDHRGYVEDMGRQAQRAVRGDTRERPTYPDTLRSMYLSLTQT